MSKEMEGQITGNKASGQLYFGKAFFQDSQQPLDAGDDVVVRCVPHRAVVVLPAAIADRYRIELVERTEDVADADAPDAEHIAGDQLDSTLTGTGGDH
jgi:hypothetical protein